MTRKIVITGCNRGIGLELAKLYRASGAEVTALVRQNSPELKELNCRVIEGFDVCDDEMAIKLAPEIGEVDVLINNAGLFENETFPFEGGDLEAMRQQFEVNTLGPLKLCSALGNQMKAGGLMAFLTSRMGSITDNTSGAYYGYRMSKAALNMGVKSLATDMKNKSVSTVLLHPGYVKTKMTGFQGEITPEQAAAGLFKIMESMTLAKTATFWHSNGEALPW